MWEDRFDENPIEAARNEDGFVQFKNTGDPLVDKWEEQIARGEVPNMLESFSPEQRERLRKMRTKGASRGKISVVNPAGNTFGAAVETAIGQGQPSSNISPFGRR